VQFSTFYFLQVLLDRWVVGVYVVSYMAKLTSFKWIITNATFLSFFSCKLWLTNWMLNVCVVSYGCLCFVFYECASDLRAKLFSISLQSYVHVFLCVKIANVLCCEKNVLYVFLVICGLLIFCFVCVLCLQSFVGHLLFLLCVLFIYCAYFVYCVRWMCHLAYLWWVFYAFRLLLSSSRMWVKGCKR
jgi:hypothetical protein